jgi:hypothetical protein
MLENKDVIAQPKRGRFFPVTVAEAKKALKDLQFTCSPYQKRLDIIFRNPEKVSPHGRIVATLYPPYELIVYSVCEDVDCQRAKIVLDEAMRQLAEFGRDVAPYDRRLMSQSFRAYHSPQDTLTITKRVRKGAKAKYRGDAKFSNAFKPKAISTDEQIMKSVGLI